MDAYIWFCDDCPHPTTGERGRYHLAWMQDDGSYSDEDGDVVIEAPEAPETDVDDEYAEWVRDPGDAAALDFDAQQREWLDYFISVAETGDDYLHEMISTTAADGREAVAARAWQHVERIAKEQGFPLPERPTLTPLHETLYDLMERQADRDLE